MNMNKPNQQPPENELATVGGPLPADGLVAPDLLLSFPKKPLIKTAPNENMKIKQVERLFNISKDTLIRYEKDGLLSPLRVGIRGDRQYTPENLITLKELITKRQEQYIKNALSMVKSRKQHKERALRSYTQPINN